MIRLNGDVLKFSTFPNAETKVEVDQVQKLLKYDNNVVDFKYETNDDITNLIFLKKYIDYIYTIKRGINLNILYMPYSRQDRIKKASAFTLKYVADIINSLKFDSVMVVEPHSDVTPALLDNCRCTYPSVELILENVIEYINFDHKKDYIFFPDAGASKRYGDMINSNLNQIVGFKDRDFETGKIKNLQILGDIKEPGFKVIIVDDLCSRGGTFMLSAEKLKEVGAKEIYLVVGHCENTIFAGDILGTSLINKVYTTDSILTMSHDKIKVTELKFF